MIFSLHITGLAKINFLGFLWVGDAITYFEFIYLPVVIILMILVTFFLKQKDQKLRRTSKEQAYYSPKMPSPNGSSASVDSPTPVNSQGQIPVLGDSPFNDSPISPSPSREDFPKQIPA